MDQKKPAAGGLIMSSHINNKNLFCTKRDYPLQRLQTYKGEDGIAFENIHGILHVPYNDMKTFIMAAAESLCQFDDKFQGKNWSITVRIEPEK
jgi:hypothetical protein